MVFLARVEPEDDGRSEAAETRKMTYTLKVAYGGEFDPPLVHFWRFFLGFGAN
ncbi:MAG: hypothetical protein ACRD3N_07020 [Terracidiphilus sp.]